MQEAGDEGHEKKSLYGVQWWECDINIYIMALKRAMGTVVLLMLLCPPGTAP